MFPRRPTANETEDDILRFQQEFLTSGSKPAATVIKKRAAPSSEHRDIVEMDVGNDVDGDYGEKETASKRSRFQEKRTEHSHMDTENIESEMDKHDTHLTVILNKIIEIDTSCLPVHFPTVKSQAFPSVFHSCVQENVDKRSLTGESLETRKVKVGRSIFAKQFRQTISHRRYEIQADGKKVERNLESIPTSSGGKLELDSLPSAFLFSKLVSGEGLRMNDMAGLEFSLKEKQNIHLENVQRLENLKESEILTERNKLLGNLDPKLIELLLNKKSDNKIQQQSMKSPEENFLDDLTKESDVIGNDVLQVDDGMNNEISDISKESLPLKIDEKWLNMNSIETDKLKWMSSVPEKCKAINLSHRFDFRGTLLDSTLESASIPTHLGLHHHGDEPHAPGYNLQELFILSRSNFMKQRVLALSILGKIVLMARRGSYDEQICDSILNTLLEAGLLQLLRYTLDEQSNPLIELSIFALHSLLILPSFEIAITSSFLMHRGCEIPSLEPLKKPPPDAAENDYDMAKYDVILALVKMNILPRIRYILEVCHSTQTCIDQCLEILIRICCHSTKSAISVYECPRLISFVTGSLLPLNWDENGGNERSLPLSKAARLLRVLCTAGRHITSRLLHDHPDITAIITRYVAVQATKLPAVHDTIMEVWRFWITCCSYGFTSDLYSNLYEVIINTVHSFNTHLQNPAIFCDEDVLFLANKCQMVFVLSSAFARCLYDQDKVDNKLAHAMSLDELSKFVALVTTTLNICMEVKQLTVVNTTLATGLEFLATFFYCVRENSSQNVIGILDIAESVCHNILLPIWNIIKSLCFSGSREVASSSILSSLPDCVLSMDSASLNYLQLFMSFLRCCVAVCKLNKICCQHLHVVVSAVAKDCPWMFSAFSYSNFSVRSRTYCCYWAVELFMLHVTYRFEKVNQSCKFYYDVAICCFSQLCSSDESLAHQLLSTVFFNADLLRAAVKKTQPVVEKFSELTVAETLQVDKRDISAGNSLIDIALTHIISIRNAYFLSLALDTKVLDDSRMRNLGRVSSISSFLLSGYEVLAPTDWPFIPLLQLYHCTMNGEEPPKGIVSNASYCLFYLCVLAFLDCLSSVSLTAKICRLMCVFLATNDLFLEQNIKDCLIFLLRRYCQNAKQSQFDFTKEIPGITSFYDFYISFLDQYQAVSYGDHVFASVALLPLHQLSGGFLKLKKAFWCDHSEVLRSFTLPLKQSLLPLSWYLEPKESDSVIIRTYVSALASGLCSFMHCPLPYAIAVHHVASYIFDNKVNLKERATIYKGMLKIEDKQVQMHILHYSCLDPNFSSEYGFIFSDSLTDQRKEIISQFEQI